MPKDGFVEKSDDIKAKYLIFDQILTKLDRHKSVGVNGNIYCNFL
jgi:hypothetical protein